MTSSAGTGMPPVQPPVSDFAVNALASSLAAAFDKAFSGLRAQIKDEHNLDGRMRDLEVQIQQNQTSFEAKYGLLNTKIVQLDKDLNGKIDAARADLNTRITKLSEKLTAKLEEKHEELSKEVGDLRSETEKMRTQGTTNFRLLLLILTVVVGFGMSTMFNLGGG